MGHMHESISPPDANLVIFSYISRRNSAARRKHGDLAREVDQLRLIWKKYKEVRGEVEEEMWD